LVVVEFSSVSFVANANDHEVFHVLKKHVYHLGHFVPIKYQFANIASLLINIFYHFSEMWSCKCLLNCATNGIARKLEGAERGKVTSSGESEEIWQTRELCAGLRIHDGLGHF